MYFEPNVHRHLDWRGPLEWLGADEYWVLEQNGLVTAALACPPDPEGVAWLRLFAHSSDVPTTEAWKVLWENAKACLAGRNLLVAAITVADWFSVLLSESGFTTRQQIVVLEQKFNTFQPRQIPSELILRPMTEHDLPAVTEVDKSGFAPLWRNSLQALQSGFRQAGFATVAQINGEIIGYQISTRNSFGAHLARLAVTAPLQGQGIGYLLVQDLLMQCLRAGLHRLTVNTQNDNLNSLALYKKIGFELTGERYTVFSLQL
jgi:ribosomal protein S18 acetylase RimI-like enzyme